MNTPNQPGKTDIMVNTRGAAEEILIELRGRIVREGSATVGQLHDLCGFTSTYADNMRGWKDLSQATIQDSPEGYLISLPPPQPLYDNQETK
jgi:hypothetical protein